MRTFITSLSIFSLFGVLAQQGYWQQEVNYNIEVRLDDKKHLLHAFEKFEYINNSPNTLEFIYIHLWPNAYEDGNTALAEQLYETQNDDILHYGPSEDRGKIDSLDFKINGQPAKWEYEKNHRDIAILHLLKPLAPGEKIEVSTPFRVKIPSGKISRLGHVEQSYQITQWYPKPAVYDHKGWHHMPYLTQGEFFSEFGSFDVTIELPVNYVVGATGDLQTPSEVAFLDSLANLPRGERSTNLVAKQKSPKSKTPFPESSKTYKKIRYTQSNVHDFAWFADKRYEVLKGEVELPESKRKVTLWSMYVPQNEKYWLKSIEYLHDATYYYSLWNGEYPYNQVTAVDGTISAGGGMEYPNVTVIGNAGSDVELEIVIVHEVGHNWFYGILGSNERVHGWMDEGINTLNEMRYFSTKYPDNTIMNDMIMGVDKIHFEELSHFDMGDIMFRAVQRFGADQPIETHSCKFHPGNYGVVMYQKTGLVFHYLKAYLGEEVFDQCMHAYFDQWKFKHPYPEDIRAVFEQKTGQDLSWVFDQLIESTRFVDYKIARAKTNDKGSSAVVKNKGQVSGPIEVNVIKDGKVVETIWTKPGERKTTLNFQTANADKIVINDNKRIPELYRNNNEWRSKGLFKKCEPLKLEFLAGDNERSSSNHFWAPAVGFNTHDNFMLGVAFHNNGIPMNRFQYLVAPMYSIGGRTVSGMAEFNYAFLPKNHIRISRFGLSVKSFQNVDPTGTIDQPFLALTPYWSADLGNKRNAVDWDHNIRIQGVANLGTRSEEIEHIGIFGEYKNAYKKTDYESHSKARLTLVSFNNAGEFTRLEGETTFKLRYSRKKNPRWMELRLYGGGFIMDNLSGQIQRAALNLSGGTGVQDLFFENYFFDRSATNGIFTQQNEENMGNFKVSSGLTTMSWMSTANFFAQIPVKYLKPFGVFADFGLVGQSVGDPLVVANMGVALRLGDIFAIYVPLYSNNEVLTFAENNLASRIRFSLVLNPMHKLNLRTLLN